MTRPTSAYLERPLRSLGSYRDQLAAELKTLPLTDRRRGRLALKIVDVDAELARLEARLSDAIDWASPE